MMIQVYSREVGCNGKCVNKMSATDTILQSITLRINEDEFLNVTNIVDKSLPSRDYNNR